MKKNNDSETLPTISVVDPHNEKAETLFNEFKQNKDSSIELLLQAAREYRKSNHPDKEKIYFYLKGMYYRMKAQKDKTTKRKLESLRKAYNLTSKVEGRNSLDCKEIMLATLSTKLDQYPNLVNTPLDLLKSRAELHKVLGHEEEYNIDMCFYYMFSVKNAASLEEFLDMLKKSEEHIEKTNKEEIKHQVKSMYHTINSRTQPTLEESIKEAEIGVAEIEQASQKANQNFPKATLAWLQSHQIERSEEERKNLLRKAGAMYENTGVKEMASQIKGTLLVDDAMKAKDYLKASELYIQAASEFGKFNKQQEELCIGHSEMALAIKEGILDKDSSLFQQHLANANNHYTNAGNFQGVQITAGIWILLSSLEQTESFPKEQLNIAINCLESIGEKALASYIRYDIARKDSADAKDDAERERFTIEAKNLLERYILEEEKRQESGLPEELSSIRNTLLEISKARKIELEAFINKNMNVRATMLKEAKHKYISLVANTTLRQECTVRLSWIGLFIDDIATASKYLDILKKEFPSNANISALEKAMSESIQLHYSPEALKVLAMRNLSNPILVELQNQVVLSINDKAYPSEFFKLCLGIISDAVSEVEKNNKRFTTLSEEELRNEVKMLTSIPLRLALHAAITGETFHSRGKTDLYAENPKDTNDKFIGECKIYHGEKAYKDALLQLTDRYLSHSEQASVLITFIKKGKIQTTYDNAQKATLEFDTKAKIQPIDNQRFISQHEDLGVIIHVLVDLRLEKPKSSK